MADYEAHPDGGIIDRDALREQPKVQDIKKPEDVQAEAATDSDADEAGKTEATATGSEGDKAEDTEAEDEESEDGTKSETTDEDGE